MKQKRLRLAAMFAAGMIAALSLTLTAAANDDSYSYIQGSGGAKSETADVPVYTVKQVLDGRMADGGFDRITDIHCAGDKIYILDSGNERVVVLNSDYSFDRVILPSDSDGTTLALASPEGLFVDESGALYIADTENQRLLQCDADGRLTGMLTAPSSDVLPKDFAFYPIDVLVDSNHFTYVLLRGSYYGALLYNENNEFSGFFGSNNVAVSILDGIARLFRQLFETNEKLAVSEQNLPYQFLDFACDGDGFIYTVSTDSKKKSGQIRKLNPNSGSTLKYKNGYRYDSADGYNFAESKTYADPAGMVIQQRLSGIAVDGGFIYALDNVYGKIYIYDDNCNAITVFGGGMGQGLRRGLFENASAIAVCGDDVLVSDQKKNTVTVFGRTEYGKTVMTAVILTASGAFNTAKPLWETVLAYNAGSQLANRGLAKGYLNEENYGEVLRYARLGKDQESYAAAFRVLENRFFTANLWWMLLMLAALAAGLTALKMAAVRKRWMIVKNEKVRVAARALFHPFDAFQLVKLKNQGSPFIACVLLLLFYIVQVINGLWAGFMYRLPNPDFNALYTLGGTVGVVLLWTVVHWGVTTLFEGKGTLRQILIITCYSLVPVIAYQILFFACSHVLAPSSTSMLTLVGSVCVFFSGVLLTVGMITIHEYGFFKALGLAMLTVVGMMIAVFILFMVLTLGQGCIGFIMNIISEVVFR